jgi:hypothetical protein
MEQIIRDLEAVFGKPSTAGFGSAVFYEVSKMNESLTFIALEDYELFVGEKWNAETKALWMNDFRKVYERTPGTTDDILTELHNVKDNDAKQLVPLLTELVENAAHGRLALTAAFNHQDITNVELYKIGDSAAMTGLILCGLFKDHSACSVICLMD